MEREKRIVVPDGMLEAANKTCLSSDCCSCMTCVGNRKTILEVALLWITDHPVMPTRSQWKQLEEDTPMSQTWQRAGEWQRRMFIALEPEVPDSIKPLLLETDAPDYSRPTREFYNSNVMAAYRLGQRSKQ